MAMEIAVKKKESKDLKIPTVPLLTKAPTLQNPESEINADRFNQSLRELKDLSSQLYHAADYCESAFPKTAHRKILFENTKNYVCEVIVRVVDHLGTVSSNLEQQVYGGNKISQTEQRIDCLKQRLLTCQQYAFTLDLSTLRWSTKFPGHHRHYIAPLAKNLEKSSDVSRGHTNDSDLNATETSHSKKDQFTEAAGEPLFDANNIVKPPVAHVTSGTELTTVIPVFESPSRFLKPSSPSVCSLAQDTFKLGSNDMKKKPLHGRSNDMKKKPLQGSNFLSFLRKSRRKT